MPRKERIHFKGALYHVICRGNNKSYVLALEEWKQKYIDLLDKYKKRYGFKLYAYVIMDNHVHLLIEVGEVHLSKIMQGVQQSFTQRYNTAFKRTGHVFEQRYKSILCDKDDYLLALVRYIHQNPVRIRKPEGLSYTFSSYRAYVEGNRELVDLEDVMAYFSNNTKGFCEFMDEEESRLKWLEDKDYSDAEEIEFEAQRHSEDKDSMSLDEIIECVLRYYAIQESDLSLKRQQRAYVTARSAIVYIAAKQEGIKLKEIALRFNMSQSNVSTILADSNKMKLMHDELHEILNLRSLTRSEGGTKPDPQ